MFYRRIQADNGKMYRFSCEKDILDCVSLDDTGNDFVVPDDIDDAIYGIQVRTSPIDPIPYAGDVPLPHDNDEVAVRNEGCEDVDMSKLPKADESFDGEATSLPQTELPTNE
jgi:hypothetical protein